MDESQLDKAIKITVERGNKQDGIKKAVAYCDIGTFDNDGFCADRIHETDPCARNSCCIICSRLFDCGDVCPRVIKVEVPDDEP